MIIIPSKSIYAKENPKIIKNDYSGVNFTAQIPLRKKNDNANVYNTDDVIYEEEKKESAIGHTEFDWSFNNAISESNKQIAVLLISPINQKHITKQITIPKKSGDTTIENIDESSVTGQIIGAVKKYETSYNYKFRGQTRDNKLEYSTIEIVGVTFIDKTLVEETFDYIGLTLENGYTLSVATELKTDAANLKKKHKLSKSYQLVFPVDVSLTDDEYNYYIQLSIACDFSFYVVQGCPKFKERQTINDLFTFDAYEGELNGFRYEFVGESITININGQSYEISLKETKMFVGDNKSNAFAIQQSNELMQNSPQLQNNIHQIYNQYKDTGKEVATIRCSVVDYFDENGKKIIAVDGSSNLFDINYITKVIRGDKEVIIETDKERKEIFFFSPFTNGTNLLLSFGGNTWNYDTQTERYYINFTKTDNIDSFVLDIDMYDATNINLIDNLSINTRNISEGETYAQAIFDLSSIESGEYSLSFDFNGIPEESTYTISNIKISYRGDTKYTEHDTLPSVFNLYDKVVPMVYTSEGTDKPMSTYTDGSPKVFQVVGNRLIYDGAVWQELTMIEVRQDEN